MTIAVSGAILAGLVLLAVGGDLLVRGAVSTAERLSVSPLLIGLTLVGFGTSMPELVTSIQAALAGSPGIAIGNVVGSNTANALLIVGVAALIRPIVAAAAAFRRDGAVMGAAALLSAAAMSAGEIGRAVGAAFVTTLIGYILITYLVERRNGSPSAQLHETEATMAPHAPGGVWLALFSVIGGLALTLLGARWLVGGALELARGLGVSETIIGLTLVAVGTSLPELVTSVMAARRGQVDVALGNIIGSNIYNVLGILGITAIITPIAVPESIMIFDIWVMLGATAALVLTTMTGWRISRMEGALLLSLYVGYIALLALAPASGT